MIALDTNVLVRHYLTDPDQPEQSERARQLVENARSKGQEIYLSAVVICESLWVLGDCYRIPKAAQIEFLDSLLRDPPFRVSNPEVISNAFKLFRTQRVDFADCLIASEAKAQGCGATFTFDKKAGAGVGMKLVEL